VSSEQRRKIISLTVRKITPFQGVGQKRVKMAILGLIQRQEGERGETSGKISG
jgi:hypothetical protein